MRKPTLSVVISIHNEGERLAACLKNLKFGDELVVVLDRCNDSSRQISIDFGAKIIEGAWDREGERRNAAINACSSDWIFEVDADEHVSSELANEILSVICFSKFDWHEIPVDNYIGDRLVRFGWGASYGKAAYPGLFRNGTKTWGPQRVHPRLFWDGRKGHMLTHRTKHFVDRDISDMIRRLDSYSSARALDIREGNDVDSYANNFRRIFSRFIKCYIGRKGYKEGGYGILIALFAGLYPIISYIKADLEEG